MEYIAALLALIIGFVIGYLISRLSGAKISENLVRAETLNAELGEKNTRIETELAQLKNELKNETESRAKAEGVLASMNSYSAMIDDTRQRLAGIFGEISVKALQQNSELFSGMAEGTLKTVAEEMKGDIAKRQEAIDSIDILFKFS